MGGAATGTSGTDPAEAPRPKGRPGRKPKGSVPVVIPETPDKPDPDHVLTWRQRKVLQVIRESVQKRGYPPSMREIGEAVGLTSTSSVSYQLSTLQKKGYLHRDVGRPRTVEVRLPGHPAVRPEPSREPSRDEEEAGEIPGIDIPSQEAAYVPLVGRIAAGGPILAEQAIEDVFPLPRQLVGEGTLFLLKVAGDSMIERRHRRRGLGGGPAAAGRGERRDRGRDAGRRGDGEDVQAERRARLADSAQPGLHADPRRRGQHPRPRRRRAPPRLSTQPPGGAEAFGLLNGRTRPPRRPSRNPYRESLRAGATRRRC